MKKVAFWIIAFLITISTAVYQKLTGPTYPLQGKVSLADTEIKYRLARSHETDKDYELGIMTQGEDISGYVIYKRHKTDDPWNKVPMVRKEESLVAKLPYQPPAGKLEYKVMLIYQGRETSLSGEPPVIIRFLHSIFFGYILVLLISSIATKTLEIYYNAGCYPKFVPNKLN